MSSVDPFQYLRFNFKTQKQTIIYRTPITFRDQVQSDEKGLSIYNNYFETKQKNIYVFSSPRELYISAVFFSAKKKIQFEMVFLKESCSENINKNCRIEQTYNL